MEIFQGKEGFGSIAIGKIYVLDCNDDPSCNDFDCDTELEKYRRASAVVLESLKADHETAFHEQDHKKVRDISLQESILTEHQFKDAVTGRVINQKCTAADAVSGAGEYFEDVFSNMQSAGTRPSRNDMKMVSEMLLNYLKGNGMLLHGMKESCIVAAKDLSSGDFLKLDRAHILGLIVENSSANSHMAILAKAYAVPAIFGCEIENIWDGRNAIVDGGWRAVYIDPDKKTVSDMKERMAADAREEKKLQKLKGVECVTLDGIHINLYGNINRPQDVEKLLAQDAQGIGLYRTEVGYIGRNTPPDEEELFNEYKSVVTSMEGKPVVIRTLDLSSDKYAPYFKLNNEKSPALGLRGIRLSLKYPQIFRTQLKALMRAGAYGDISVMYPMVTSVRELGMASDIMDDARNELNADGSMYRELKVGTMIETPAAVFISDDLARHSAFLSIGTNDLTQYALGVDRENSELSDVCDYHHPSIVKMIRIVTHNAHKNNIPVGICGELASDPEFTRIFLELGVDSLSVVPADILKLRNSIVNMRIDKEKV